MKIFSAKQAREWDEYTIRHHYKHSAELMERAAHAVSSRISELVSMRPVHVICGIGNNGGDGLCIARLLFLRGYDVEATVVGDHEKGSPDFLLNLRLLQETVVPILFVTENQQQLHFKPGSLVIDCILGSGTNRPAEGLIAEMILQINRMEPCIVIAIDLPSGLQPDTMQRQDGAIVKAHITLSFESPKRAMVVEENAEYVGEFKVLSIGLDKVFHDDTASTFWYYDQKSAAQQLRPRKKFTHKHTYGHVHMLAGSYGKIGAAVLASRGALRAGAGLVTTAVPWCGYTIMQTAVPEAMCEPDAGERFLQGVHYDERFDCTAIGPGIGREPETALMLRRILKEARRPLVLDADALNIIARKNLQKEIPPHSIITPHRREFHRLFGEHDTDEDRLATLIQKAQELDIYIVLKGANTRVASPSGQVSFNASGNSGMATAGAGDVLTGAIAAMLAQGYAPETAARLGVFIHGMAGDMVQGRQGMAGMMASDIADAIPFAQGALLNDQTHNLC